MTLNFQHLRAFYAVASDQSVSRAARRLNISQSTLSKQVKALEERYQVTLIEGKRPPLTLTPVGADVYERARELFGIADDIGGLFGEVVADSTAVIRLGTDSPPYAADFMAAYLEAAPNTEFKTVIANAKATTELLLKAQIDLAIICDPFVHSDYTYVPLYTDRLAAILPADWPSDAADGFNLACLANETLLVREHSSRTLAAIGRLLVETDTVPRRTMEMHTREMIREAVARKIGISFMFREECPPDPRLKVMDINSNSRTLGVTGYLAVRTDRRRLPAIKRAVEIARLISTQLDELPGPRNPARA